MIRELGAELSSTIGEHEAVSTLAPGAVESDDLEAMPVERIIVNLESGCEAAFVRWAEEMKRAHRGLSSEILIVFSSSAVETCAE